MKAHSRLFAHLCWCRVRWIHCLPISKTTLKPKAQLTLSTKTWNESMWSLPSIEGCVKSTRFSWTIISRLKSLFIGESSASWHSYDSDTRKAEAESGWLSAGFTKPNTFWHDLLDVRVSCACVEDQDAPVSWEMLPDRPYTRRVKPAANSQRLAI